MIMSSYASVDKEACIACGSCNAAAPDIFDFDTDGIAEVIYEGDNNRGITMIKQEMQDDLQDAIESCPTNCIKLAQVPFS
ncbi:ferredoxin [Fontibacillus panacisegetis]|uniref:Ferredoxin n=2 Tax=Fontibacillus panacisegetis TaxID=670482 RepID=A0A1G7E888_9BACL|nr:ferredoxin [Fontibacillus panacisegetis]